MKSSLQSCLHNKSQNAISIGAKKIPNSAPMPESMTTLYSLVC